MNVAIVTGASSGIGRAIAIELAREGYLVINASRREKPKEGGAPTHQLIKILGGFSIFYELDLSHSSKVNSFVEWIRDRIVPLYGKVDVLVNNAGVLPLKDRYTIEEMTQLFKVNVFSHYFITQELIRQGLFSEGAVVIFISSVSGVRGEPDDIIYGASKASLINIVKGLTRKYPKYRFVGISPGLIRTWLVGDPGKTPKDLIERIPLKRMGNPKEVAKLVIHVVKNKFINGCNIVIDGGETCWG